MELRCGKCKETKPEEEFYSNRSRSTGRSSYCKVCQLAAVQVGRRKTDIDGVALPPALKCAICNRKPPDVRLCYDHDHVTEMFRGWLCGQCNTALGMFEDSLYRLQRAAGYLRRAKRVNFDEGGYGAVGIPGEMLQASLKDGVSGESVITGVRNGPSP